MGSQLLQSTKIIKQLTYYFWKSEENMDQSRTYLAVKSIKLKLVPKVHMDLQNYFGQIVQAVAADIWGFFSTTKYLQAGAT